MMAVPYGRAHGKCILIGEHAVVHGTSAIALPVGLHIDVTLGKQAAAGLNPTFNTWFGNVAAAHCGERWLPSQISGNLPRGAGLGSSAALAVAALRALATQKPMTNEQLTAWADDCERLFHGNPSGIDVRAVLSDVAIIFKRGNTAPTVQALPPFVGEWHFQLWITPSGDSTAKVVARVGSSLQSSNYQAELAQAEQIIEAAKMAAISGQQHQLGRQMFAFHQWLAKHGASTALLDNLVDLAKQHGALGAKLTGGGGGGAMLVLAPSATWHAPQLPDNVTVLSFCLPSK